jgi:hypothetical protein
VNENGSSLFTRRRWLKMIPGSVIAMTGTAGTASAEYLSAEQTTRSAPEDNLAAVYNIRDYGAKGDAVSLDTTALQTAIDFCHRRGGGTVLVPAGTFLIGTVEIRSNITLHLAASAKLLGSADGKQYRAVDAIPLSGDTTLDDGNWALLFAVNAQRITIEGAGTIDGQGAQFRDSERGTSPPSGLGGLNRPYHLLCYRCEDLTVRGVSLVDCAYHSIRVIQSTRVQMNNLYIHNRVNGNNDGFHFISGEHVTVSNCTVKSQDDGCAMFGSCKFITIANSSFSTRWSVFRFGGGSAENITVSNCLLYQVYGCPIKFQVNAGSVHQNISFSNLLLHDVTGPIHLSVGPRPSGENDALHTEVSARPKGSPGEKPAAGSDPSQGILRNISFSNIHGTVTTNPGQLPENTVVDVYHSGERHSCITLNCVGGAVMENISLDNIHLTFGGGGTAEEAAGHDLPEIAGEYFMLGPMPAYGLYARNVRGLSLQNMRFQVSTPDLRPAVILEHVQDVAVNGLSVQGNTAAESVLRFKNCQQVLMTAARVLTPSSAFLQLEGAENSGIIIDGGDVSKAATKVAFRSGATDAAVELRN